MAYDTPIPSFNTYKTNNLRLWKSLARNTFDLDQFNSSDYHGAIKDRQRAEYITSVLYPGPPLPGLQTPCFLVLLQAKTIPFLLSAFESENHLLTIIKIKCQNGDVQLRQLAIN